MTETATVRMLSTYPIKGLSPQSLDKVTLTAGSAFPGDRMFGFARANSGFDPENPRPMPKNKFLVLAQEAALARLKTVFDPDTRSMHVTLDDRDLTFDLSQPDGQAEAVEFLAGHLDLGDGQTPGFVHASPHRFTDVSVVSDQMMHAISILNLDSLRDLEKKTGTRIDPGRFRANLVIDGWPPFSELEMIDQEVTISDVRLRLIFHTRRCAATQVNLETAQRDMEIPRLLHQHYGHMNMGVYAEVLQGGVIALGQKIRIER